MNLKTFAFACSAALVLGTWATGIEVDVPESGAACLTPRATSSHLKVTAWELRDQTDGVGEKLDFVWVRFERGDGVP